MARVEADPEPRVVVELVVDRAPSSSVERPIVPPVPAEFSISSQRSSVVSSSSDRSAGTTRRSPREAVAQMRADVEDHALGPDRVGRLQRARIAVADFLRISRSGEARLTR